MATEQQLRVINAVVAEELGRGLVIDCKPSAVRALLIAFGIRILEATQADSWEMGAVEADDDIPCYVCGGTGDGIGDTDCLGCEGTGKEADNEQ